MPLISEIKLKALKLEKLAWLLDLITGSASRTVDEHLSCFLINLISELWWFS